MTSDAATVETIEKLILALDAVNEAADSSSSSSSTDSKQKAEAKLKACRGQVKEEIRQIESTLPMLKAKHEGLHKHLQNDVFGECSLEEIISLFAQIRQAIAGSASGEREGNTGQ
ncbi:unnamed protein product [Vitrella brassicaformis CCMP3155]|uniref:Uncharacterized protein n=2 Tax=Vitrella brassicaformis TaxID=1169539 RepID=A0A0G4EEN9_VITBC|nr:unnamed protein product [Vitrella brassicaformis CCMP3155]|eukprot:CEL94007.1 unnamed protein product [Vitrella brassicaformis CCMP3155]